MSGQKPLVLIVGATGFTGQSVVTGLLQSGNFRVAALVRPSSLEKPAVKELRASGVEIRPGDVTDPADKLKEVLSGVDIIVCTIIATLIEAQRELFRVAKEVGVKRVVPNDWATPGQRGVRQLHDQKLAIRDYVKEIGLDATFIDVGWWMQGSLPLPSHKKTALGEWLESIYGDGNDKMLVTDLRHIGTYVARILADPRTVNHAVMVWEDEVTQLQAHEIGEAASGEADVIKAKRKYVSAEEVLQRIEQAKATLAKNPTDFGAVVALYGAEYMRSMHLLGENSLESAKRLGYLDARELYPDIPKHTLADFAKEFYTNPSLQAIFDKDLSQS
ncbi:NAD-P-binding protein [Trametes elegans]|nr:NAD-P-binding protein [Trametes elegans]